MKRDLISTLLVTALVASTLAASGACYWFLKSSRDLRRLQMQVAAVNQKRAILQSMVFDLNEYSRRNPSITPLLDKIGLRLPTNTNAPSSRP